VTVQLQLGGHAFNRASHPGESSLWKRKFPHWMCGVESKNGHRPGIDLAQCPFYVGWIFNCLFG
jgi:hypothetical protein